jgi:hypothetical protein
MAFRPGDRVELVATHDPYTRLRPGDRGTVTGVRDFSEPTIDVHWDNGSTLSILPEASRAVGPCRTHRGLHKASQPGSGPTSTGSSQASFQLPLWGGCTNERPVCGNGPAWRSAPTEAA